MARSSDAEETPPGRPGQRRLQIGVVEQDLRRLAAQLEEQPLQRGPGLLHDPPADRRGAGERDEVNARIEGEYLADEAATTPPH
jgi:hypothetical protein